MGLDRADVFRRDQPLVKPLDGEFSGPPASALGWRALEGLRPWRTLAAGRTGPLGPLGPIHDHRSLIVVIIVVIRRQRRERRAKIGHLDRDPGRIGAFLARAGMSLLIGVDRQNGIGDRHAEF